MPRVDAPSIGVAFRSFWAVHAVQLKKECRGWQRHPASLGGVVVLSLLEV